MLNMILRVQLLLVRGFLSKVILHVALVSAQSQSHHFNFKVIQNYGRL